ncbi:delta-12 fatty acid desaturas-like protein [Hypoxylon cercidicola]|nr:delta-12 fatty acid desaturas-like protein [Hypoxylon cercidicola]
MNDTSLVTEPSRNNRTTNIDIKTIRDQIPAHCFKPSTFRSIAFVLHDLGFYFVFLAGTLCIRRYADSWTSFILCYVIFPYLAGICLTGLWILGHEAGHGAFSSNSTVANSIGFVIHSALMSPYFAWRSSHARHHQHMNNLSTDLNYVPPVRKEHMIRFGTCTGGNDWSDMMEDAPIVIFLRILLQHVIGWPWYLLSHITAGPNSSPRKSRGWWDNSHFLPNSSLFRKDEFWYILVSDVGILSMCAVLYTVGQSFGSAAMVWTYVLPWMWVNHWIVMITYLHHTSPSLPKYTPESWTYLRGALATVDRDPGFFLKHMFHHIIDTHVVHHLFPRIPHYHAQEATEAIKPLLGAYYHVDRTSLWRALWIAFTECQWVEPDSDKTFQANIYNSSTDTQEVDGRAILWYRPGCFNIQGKSRKW